MSSASAHRIRLLPAIDAAKASGAGDGAFFCLAATAAKTARCNENNGLAFRHDWGYKDHGISGTRGRDKRPGFDKLCRDAARREFDVVMAWSVDRLGRSLQDLVGFLSELHALKIDLFLHQQGLDTTTPAGKAMFQMMVGRLDSEGFRSTPKTCWRFPYVLTLR